MVRFILGLIAIVAFSSCEKVDIIPEQKEPTESIQVMFDKSVGQLVVNGQVYSVGNTEGMGVKYIEAKEIKQVSFMRFGGDRTEVTIQKKGVIIRIGNVKNFSQSWAF